MPTNRIAKYLADGPGSPPDLATPPFADRLRMLRGLGLGLIAVALVFAASVIGVVTMALGGRPLSGNAGLAGGVPVVTVVAAFASLTCLAVAAFAVPAVWARGAARVKSTPADPPDEGAEAETQPDRLWRVYAAGVFTEFALAEAAAVVTAVLFHLTADWLMMGFVAAMVAYMAVRLPTAAKARAWFETYG